MTAPTVLVSGPWSSVRTTTEPFDDNAAQLVDGVNGYVADPAAKSGFFARPGWVLENGGSPINGSGSGGTGIWCYVAQAGTTYNFFTANGKLYRAASDFSSVTDVTPTNITLDAGATTRVYLRTFNDSLIVTDGVNIPWVGTALGSTPITATVIPAGVDAYAAGSTRMDIGVAHGGTDVQVWTAPFIYKDKGTHAVVSVPTSFSTPTLSILTNGYWAAFRLYVATGAGTTITVAGYSNVATEALAIAGLPAVPANALDLGYFTVQAQATHGWIGGTDALAGGTSGNPAQATNYYPTVITDFWAAYGPSFTYAGSLFFFASNFNGASSRELMIWSEPRQPLLGYEQTTGVGYTNFWNLTQTSPDAIYAALGTDLAIYYARATSWGTIVGAPGAGFSASATTDTVSVNVGTVSPDSVRQFGDYIYFTDREGRPYRMAFGSAPEPLWLQMRSVWTANAAGAARADLLSYMTSAQLQPELNLYTVAIWSPTPGTPTRPTALYAFDASTGLYMGYWTITPGIAVSCTGLVRDSNGTSHLAVLGTLTAGGTTGCYLWVQSLLTDGNWEDNGAVPTIKAVTGRLGYATDVAWASRKGTILAMSNAPVTVTVETPYTSSTTEATALGPGASQDLTFRIPVGLDLANARGMQFTVSPTTATSQWGLEQVQVVATPRAARIDDL